MLNSVGEREGNLQKKQLLLAVGEKRRPSSPRNHRRPTKWWQRIGTTPTIHTLKWQLTDETSNDESVRTESSSRIDRVIRPHPKSAAQTTISLNIITAAEIFWVPRKIRRGYCNFSSLESGGWDRYFMLVVK
jgi:hypothetical protein